MADTVTTADFTTTWGLVTTFDTTGDVTKSFILQDNTTTAEIWLHHVSLTVCPTQTFATLSEGTGGSKLFEYSSVSPCHGGGTQWDQNWYKAPICLKAYDGTGLALSAGDGRVTGLVHYTRASDATS